MTSPISSVVRTEYMDRDIGLPGPVRNRVFKGIRYDREERTEIFEKFVQKFLKLNSEDPEDFGKCVVHLNKTADRERKKGSPGQTSKKLSYRKRKELGLYTLARNGLKYKDLLPLHKLWIEYMTKFINFDELREQSWTNSPDDPNFEQVSLKLYRADYHGCEMTVLKSSCPSYVGVSGIVAMETKNCFKLLGADNVVRSIPKATCVFKFRLDEFEFEFFGRNLQVKPAERSSKKVKTIYVSDLYL